MEQHRIRDQETARPVRDRHSMAQNAAYLLSTQWLLQCMRVLHSFVLARYLGPELYGWFSYGQAWYLAFLPLTGLGIGVILSREVGRSHHLGSQLMARSLALRILAAIVVAIGSGVVGWFTETHSEARRLILVFSVALIGHALSTWTTQVFTAYESTRYFLRQQALMRPLEVLIAFVVLAAGYGAMAVATVHALAWWLQSLYGLTLIRRHLTLIQGAWTWRSLVSLLVQGLPIAGGIVLVNWFQQGPLVLFRHTVGEGPGLGQLALAIKVFALVSAIASTIPMAALPILSRTAARQDDKNRVFVEGMLRIGLLLGAAAGFVGIAAGPLMAIAILGPSYEQFGHLLGPALWLLIPWIWGNSMWHVTLAHGQMLASTLCAALGATVLTLALPLCVASLEATGVLVAAGAGMGIWALSLLFLLHKAVGFDVSRTVLRPGGVVLVALWLFLTLNLFNVWFALLAALLALFVGILVSGTLTSEERTALISFIGAAGR